LLEGCPIVISGALLVAACSFEGGLDAGRVAGAIGRGLWEGGLPPADLCPIDSELCAEARGSLAPAGAEAMRDLLDELDFDRRMQAARAVVVAVTRLQERTLRSSVAFEIATRARQGGVPAYAVVAKNELSPFDARILDLQLILTATGTRSLVAAGRRLAEVA
jgi:glycerate kinase